MLIPFDPLLCLPVSHTESVFFPLTFIIAPQQFTALGFANVADLNLYRYPQALPASRFQFYHRLLPH